MKTMWSRLRNPDTLLIALLVFLLLTLPVAVFGDIYESWEWYWLAVGGLALTWLSLYAGSWCARKYGVRKVNGWFLRAWVRKSLLVIFVVLIAANVVIRSETCSWFGDCGSVGGDIEAGVVPVVEVPSCVDGLEADLAFYEDWNTRGKLVELKASPSELLTDRQQELGCDGELTEDQQSRVAELDQAFSAAVDALNEQERADRTATLQRQQDEAGTAAQAPETFEVADYTELNFEPPQGNPPSLDDFHDVIDDSRSAPVPGFHRRTVYKKHKINGFFPKLLFGALGTAIPGGFTRTTVVEEVVEGVARNSFDVEKAVARLAPLFEGLSVDDQLRLKDLIAAELEVAVINGEMSKEDANSIFAKVVDVTMESAANDAEAEIMRHAEAICAGLRDGKVPNESVKSMLVGNPRLVQLVSACIDKAVPAGETKAKLLNKLAEWGN